MRSGKTWGRSSRGVGGALREGVLLCSQGHNALRAEAYIDDLGPADDVDRLVGVLRDVVCASAVVLNEHVVHGLAQNLFDALPDAFHCG